MTLTQLIGLLGSLLVCAAVGLTVHLLAGIPQAPIPSLGNRGERRRQVLAAGGVFASFDPVLRRFAAWVAPLPLAATREGLEKRLLWAGHFLGATADEAVVLSLLGGVIGVAAGYLWTRMSGASFMWICMTGALGALWFSLQLDLETRRRRKEVDRQLPPAIDLLSLCVGAGSDFPAALRFTLLESAKGGTLQAELSHILQELELGHTRQKALQGFAERLPTAAVRDFVNAVVQAEEKGNPLSEVLEIQARMLRMRRSVAAEEAAAKAGVRLLLPLVLLMLCIMLILFGSLMIKGMSGGF